MRLWTVGGAIVADGDHVLLVRNQRADGNVDWSTPGGVIDAGETMLGGLGREVREETGVVVTSWEGPLYRVEAVAPEMDWHLGVEVHLATGWSGALRVDDPDGIVTDARWVSATEGADLLASSWRVAREPLCRYLDERFEDGRTFRYEVQGDTRGGATVVRL